MDILTLRDAGKNWTVRRIDTGDRYGLDDGLINQGGPLIEFYDTAHMHTEYGQFVSRYSVETLTGPPYGRGLDLACDVTGWELSADAMVRVVEFITQTTKSVKEGAQNA